MTLTTSTHAQKKNPHKQADTQLSAKCENRMKFKNLLFVELVSVFPPLQNTTGTPNDANNTIT